MRPAAFFKYCTANVAKIVLATQKIRWSSPALFNDPFDCLFSLAPKFDVESVKARQKERLLDILTDNEEPRFDPSNPFAVHLKQLRAICRNRSRQELAEELFPDIDSYFSDFDARTQLTDALWKNEYDELTILCVCEHHDNLLLWSHYADCHSGAVLQLDCIEELDVPLLAAEPVVYSHDAPSMATDDEWIDTALGLRPLTEGLDIWKRLVLTKAKGWEYEHEWRVVTKRRLYEKAAFEDTPFSPREISKVFLGCKIKESERDDILALLSGPFQHVTAFQAKQETSHFRLSFEKIK